MTMDKQADGTTADVTYSMKRKRFGNWYSKKVVDHECEEPLDVHQGHGSDKPELKAARLAETAKAKGNRYLMDGNIFNSRGIHVAIVRGPTIFDLKGKKLYDLKGVNIYKLSGELVGHLPDQNTKRNLDKSTDKLFPAS